MQLTKRRMIRYSSV